MKRPDLSLKAFDNSADRSAAALEFALLCFRSESNFLEVAGTLNMAGVPCNLASTIALEAQRLIVLENKTKVHEILGDVVSRLPAKYQFTATVKLLEMLHETEARVLEPTAPYTQEDLRIVCSNSLGDDHGID
jgi:hypothetical protein